MEDDTKGIPYKGWVQEKLKNTVEDKNSLDIGVVLEIVRGFLWRQKLFDRGVFQNSCGFQWEGKTL